MIYIIISVIENRVFRYGYWTAFCSMHETALVSVPSSSTAVDPDITKHAVLTFYQINYQFR